jgi:hypothetical protein
MAFLDCLLITVDYARHLISWDTNMSATFEEEHGLMLVAVPRDVISFNEEYR